MECPHCKKKIVKYPLKDENGKPIIKNWFKMDMYSIILFVLVIFLVVGYKADIQKCEEVIEEPCTFCMNSNCCKEMRVFESDPLPEYNLQIFDEGTE